MKQLFVNNAKTTAGLSIAPTDTTITVATGMGAKFPTPIVGQEYFLVTLEIGGVIEIVRCTSRSGDILTIDTRGMEGTVAASFPVGTAVECRATAATFSSFFNVSNLVYSESVYEYTTGAGQTTFAATYSTPPVVYRNGVRLDIGSYVASNFTSVTIPSALTGDIVTIVVHSSINYANAMPVSGGGFTGPVTIPGGAINNTTIGATTPSTGAFSILSTASSVTPNVSYILAQSGVPVCLAPSGTVATNGTITIGTALLRVYSNGIWLRLPAGAVVGGAAGVYWCVMSTTTVGQVYTTFIDPSLGFTPYIPTGTLTNAAGSNIVYTQITGSDIILASGSVPGNALGLNGSLRIRSLISNNINANSKVIKHYLGGTSFVAIAATASSNELVLNNVITNTGMTSAQISQSWGINGTSNSGVITGNINTTLAQSISVTAQIANAADYIVLEAGSVEVLPS